MHIGFTAKKNSASFYELYGFVIGDFNHVEMVFSFERESGFEIAQGIWMSVKEIYQNRYYPSFSIFFKNCPV